MSVYVVHFREGCDDAVSIMRVFQMNTMHGRPLDLTSIDELMEGDTWPIFVSRQNLFEDGMRELLEEGAPFTIPLEVTFYGERAEDYGGPRKEFLSLMCREVTERLFVLDKESNGYILVPKAHNQAKGWYYGAGIVMGRH